MCLDLTQQGRKLQDVLLAIGRKESSYFDWRKTDEQFKNAMDAIREMRRRGEKVPLPDFPDFCEKYLGFKLYLHQLQWYDLLEGRTPRDLHPSQTFEQGDPQFLLVNCPPEHGKTITLSISYAVWRLCKDPNVRILFVSKTQEMAKQIMWAIKNRLTHPKYMRLQVDFGPPGGSWKQEADKWSATEVYFGAERDSGEKDPTMRATGLGGQIYGSRLDLCFVDDAVVLSNAHEYEKQIRWL